MKLTLVPYAGLCNRMNAIMSALSYQKKTGIKPTIFWEKTSDCCAWFDELFEPIPSLEIGRLNDFYLKPSEKRNLYLPSLIRTFIFDKSFQGEKISNEDILINGKNLGNVYVSSSNRFCPLCETECLGRHFVPLQHIQERINAITSQYTTDTIGVHIRRTDNVAAISNSPIELFFLKMNEAIRNNSNVNFFLATDDSQLKSEIKRKYKDRLITFDSTLNRYSREGMEDAVIELWALSLCAKILGSSHSTYSSFASKLYGCPIEIIEDNASRRF